MKASRNVIRAATVCLAVGASGTALAVDCATGNLIGQTVDEVVINGQSCYMERVVVTGNVTVVDSEDLTMYRVDVGGTIRVIGGGTALLVANTGQGMAVRNNEYVNLVTNVAVRNIRVVNNLKANVKKNAAPIILCRGNLRLDSYQNEAVENRCRALGGGFDDIGG